MDEDCLKFERLVFVPVTSSTASNLSLDEDNDSFWREDGAGERDNPNQRSWSRARRGNKLGPGHLSCNRALGDLSALGVASSVRWARDSRSSTDAQLAMGGRMGTHRTGARREEGEE
ncbi:hypothetical protein EG329_014354 [Mollisiaceae sp. DMI_Dod_QoI]|nr:hypothetical protein EG329_014354 [Helotiales sp. DMI_Dod_QoI]